MHFQDLLLWERLSRYGFSERINGLCEWRKKYGVDGFVRYIIIFIRSLEPFQTHVTYFHICRMEMDW